MAKAYWISIYRSVSNPEALAAYGALAGPSLQAAGGKFLARGVPSATFEAGLKERTVLVEFESVAAAQAAYKSEGYQAALKHLTPGAVDREIRIIEAL